MNSNFLFLIGFLILATVLRADEPSIISTYEKKVAHIITQAMNSDEGWKKLEILCKRYPGRLSGTNNLEAAIQWAKSSLQISGLPVELVPVQVPNWIRGVEKLELVLPESVELSMLGLGMSVGTMEGGLEGPVVSVKSFEELHSLGEAAIRRKIVLYNVPFDGYSKTVKYRVLGASEAAKLGAIAALVRTVGTGNPNNPHTGSLYYTPGVGQIPAAAISHRSADKLQNLLDAGQSVRVRLKMGAKFLPDSTSYNVVADIPGINNQKVVFGAHIDSWDVGEGAQDDGAGVIVSMEALRLIQVLIQQDVLKQPKRTLRMVLWTNEENGTRGGKAYREWIGDDIQNHVSATEMDYGAEMPTGFGLTLPEGVGIGARIAAEEILSLLKPIGATRLYDEGDGADISPLMEKGVAGLSVEPEASHYFDWHHSVDDTLDKVSPLYLKQHTAAMAALQYVLADMPQALIEY